MLNRGRDDVFAVTLRGFADSANRKVVCFGSAGRENDLVRPRTDQRRDLPSGLIHRRARFLTEHVYAGSVAEFVSQVRQYRFEHGSVDRRRGTMIEVNSSHTRVTVVGDQRISPPTLQLLLRIGRRL